jgi:Flp pilus assembly protein TadG
MTNLTPKANLPVLTGHLWRNQRGVAAVEFALVAAVLSFVLPAATDLALALWANQQVGNAARAGTEYAATQAPSYNSSAISAAATSGTTTAATSQRSAISATSSEFCGNASASGVTQTCILPCACASGPTTGTYVSVTASTTYTPIFPAMWGNLLTSGSMKLSATSVTRIN